MKFNVAAKYKLVVRNGADDSIARESDWFPNLITGAGIEWLLTATSYTAFRAVAGAGNVTPSISDTTLQSYLGACTTKQADSPSYQATASPYWVRRTITFRGALGAVVGNVSEVGVAMSGSPTASTTLFSRALVVDSNGNPTTVPVTSEEYLDIVWEFTIYLAETQGTFNQVIDGVTTAFDYTLTALGLGGSSINTGWGFYNTNYDLIYPMGGSSSDWAHIFESNGLLAVTSLATAGSDVGTVGPNGTYDPVSYSRPFRVSAGLDIANFATGIGLLTAAMGTFRFQLAFTGNKVMKTASKIYSFDFNVAIVNGAP